jgi:hypothetical protein
VHQVRRGEEVAQESEPGEDGAEGVRLGAYVEELDFQRVSRMRALHEDGPGEGMDAARIDARDGGVGGAGAELAVGGVSRLQYDLLALVDLQDRRDVGMQPIVPRGGLFAESLPAVDLDALHGSSPPAHP